MKKCVRYAVHNYDDALAFVDSLSFVPINAQFPPFLLQQFSQLSTIVFNFLVAPQQVSFINSGPNYSLLIQQSRNIVSIFHAVHVAIAIVYTRIRVTLHGCYAVYG